MHPNPAFRGVDSARNLAFARQRGFGVLTVNGEDGPLLSHVPFLVTDEGTSADLHLVRSNPIARVTEKVPAVIAINGGDAYISPDWYGLDDQVPTWNYVAVHLRGTLEPLPVDQIRDLLNRQSAAFETRLPKTPWTMDKMSAGIPERMMRQILPFRLLITEIQGTWKLNQNKPEDARISAADHVAKHGLGFDGHALATLMRNPPET